MAYALLLFLMSLLVITSLLLISMLIRTIIVPLSGLTQFLSGSLDEMADQGTPYKARRDEVGQFARTFDTMVRALKMTSSELRRQTQFMDNIIQNIPLALVVKDPKTDYTLSQVNALAEDILGEKAQDIVGASDFDIFPEDIAEDLRKQDEQTVNSGSIIRIEEKKVEKKDGTVFDADITRVPVYNEKGEPNFLMVLIQDVTDRVRAKRDTIKAREEAEKANNAKSEFLANMSHELRTPMNSVLGMTRLLLDEEDTSPEHSEMLSTIYKSGTSLLDIVNDILDLSKIESGQMELEKIPFSLNDKVTGVIDALSPLASEKGITLYSKFSEHDLPNLYENCSRHL